MDTPALDMLDKLLPRLRELRRLQPPARALAARDLAAGLHEALALIGDEAITQAVGLRERSGSAARASRSSYYAMAETLGLSHSRINHRVTRYRQWLLRRHEPESTAA